MIKLPKSKENKNKEGLVKKLFKAVLAYRPFAMEVLKSSLN